jgi:hypothetical protein
METNRKIVAISGFGGFLVALIINSLFLFQFDEADPFPDLYLCAYTIILILISAVTVIFMSFRTTWFSSRFGWFIFWIVWSTFAIPNLQVVPVAIKSWINGKFTYSGTLFLLSLMVFEVYFSSITIVKYLKQEITLDILPVALPSDPKLPK